MLIMCNLRTRFGVYSNNVNKFTETMLVFCMRCLNSGRKGPQICETHVLYVRVEVSEIHALMSSTCDNIFILTSSVVTMVKSFFGKNL